ncbi:biosynthetic peptidoglycan transglycosylase-like isoform X2 [Macadamia integrifolia]|uniref:biosynthetic peptidoglycan transglycosylase-like isoform X2 n=1 Tax=Macadamia integrifolia TaxID=60698 RepID=UPI001C4F3844|nr:biosynthetic peptidoglycan transglycosylase-like isoform X2 [Macadamia integrifolia]
MALFAANSLRLHIIHYSLPKHPNRETIQIRSSNPTFSFFFSSNSSRGRNWAKGRVYSFYPWNSHQKPLRKRLNLEAVFLCVFFAILLYIRLLFTLLPLDFPQRWRWLMVFAEEADDRARSYPSHLWQAVVASEDRRFFRHCGIDPVGIARAVFYLSARGGGSTITQQLVKNAFLTTQRTFSRKIIEVVLAVILERMMSKWKILNTYLNNHQFFISGSTHPFLVWVSLQCLLALYLLLSVDRHSGTLAGTRGSSATMLPELSSQGNMGLGKGEQHMGSERSYGKMGSEGTSKRVFYHHRWQIKMIASFGNGSKQIRARVRNRKCSKALKAELKGIQLLWK